MPTLERNLSDRWQDTIGGDDEHQGDELYSSGIQQPTPANVILSECQHALYAGPEPAEQGRADNSHREARVPATCLSSDKRYRTDNSGQASNSR